MSDGDPGMQAALGDILAMVEAGRQGVTQRIKTEADVEMVFNGALALVSSAIDYMNEACPGLGTSWYEGLRKIARGEEPV